MPTLTTPTKLAAFAAALAVTFGGAAGLGALVDPTDGDARPATHGGGHAGSAEGGHSVDAAGGHSVDAAEGRDGEAAGEGGSGHGEAAGTADAGHEGEAAAGLASVQDGYRLVPERTRAAAGRPGVLRFRIEGPDGRTVRSGYELESERELHLIVVRRDGTGFQHLHPRRATDGTWSTPLTLASGGSHRVLADFVVGGTRRTLGVDVEASGSYRPAAPAGPTRATDADGYRVTLAGAPRAGRETTLRFRVTRGGRPVAGLQPYLGARGHLVALREGDLAYLHVHPTEGKGHGGSAAPEHGGSAAPADDGHGASHADGGAGTTTHDDAASAPHEHDDAADRDVSSASGTTAGTVGFAATFPAAGRHRLYFQFRVGGIVRTASFVAEVAR